MCPRVVLVSTWTDGKFGMPGGGLRKDEMDVNGLNREFQEEVGSDIEFNDDDFCFSCTSKIVAFVYCKITRNVAFFENVLKSFPDQSRDAYVNEIIGAVGYPIWIEGPEKVEDISWSNNVWGFPRHLCAQGGMYVCELHLSLNFSSPLLYSTLHVLRFTPTLGNTHTPRDHLIIILLLKEIVPFELMRRVFVLAASFDSPCPLGDFDAFLIRTGLCEHFKDSAVTEISDDAQCGANIENDLEVSDCMIVTKRSRDTYEKQG